VNLESDLRAACLLWVCVCLQFLHHGAFMVLLYAAARVIFSCIHHTMRVGKVLEAILAGVNTPHRSAPRVQRWRCCSMDASAAGMHAVHCAAFHCGLGRGRDLRQQCSHPLHPTNCTILGVNRHHLVVQLSSAHIRW
jgi:hypothetical protein